MRRNTRVGTLLVIVAWLQFSVVDLGAEASSSPVEILKVEPHSHVLCGMIAVDPWASCLVVAYRNVSAQPITAIRFEATIINAMKESDPSVLSCEGTTRVKPSKTSRILCGDGEYWQKYGDSMTAKVRVVKVMFADGTFWVGGSSIEELTPSKIYAQAIVDGMAGLFPNARVTVIGVTAFFYDDNADARMCAVVKSGRTVLQVSGITTITVSSRMGEICRF